MAEPLKEILFNPCTVGAFADCISCADVSFEREAFLKRVFGPGWDSLELKERLRRMTLCLKDFLPGEYRPALEVLRRAAGLLTEGSFCAMVFSDFVEVYGLDDWDASLPALGEFTRLISAEFAVRPFLSRDLQRMMAQMRAWAESSSPQQRRLASEGCRPRLPWGLAVAALKANPGPILPILERLKNDEDESVRRSVANNLNDISKDHPQVVVDVLSRWKAEGLADYAEIASRALRTLIKDSYPPALALSGFSYGAQVEVCDFKIEPLFIPAGGEVTFSFLLRSTAAQEQALVVDYVVHLVRARGRQVPKVFKLTKKTLAPGGSVKISKKHSFAVVTTRRYYPGIHVIELQVNGMVYARGEFVLETV